MGYTLLNGDDPSIESFRGVFFKLSRALGMSVFGINQVRVPAGMEGVEHDEVETGHEEVYIVLAGGGTFTVDGEDVAVAAGDDLRIHPDATRLVYPAPDGLTTSLSPRSLSPSTTAARPCDDGRRAAPRPGGGAAGVQSRGACV